MEWRQHIKQEKAISSLQLEQPDIAYQVWELGRILANISEVFRQIKMSLENKKKSKNLSDLVRNTTSLFEEFLYLCSNLSKGPVSVLRDKTEIEHRVKHFLKADKGVPTLTEVESIRQEIDQCHKRITYELRAKSIHLRNIFGCSFGLNVLLERVISDIHSNEVERLVEESIENLEKLEKGDKVLVSPNLEMTPANLRIVKLRLRGLKKHLSKFREFAQKDPDTFSMKINTTAEMVENVILDIKNPSDYLSLKRRLLINLVPFFVCYYAVVTPIVIFVELDLWKLLLADKIMLVFVSGLIPLFVSSLWWLFNWTKNQLIVRSFRIRVSDIIS